MMKGKCPGCGYKVEPIDGKCQICDLPIEAQSSIMMKFNSMSSVKIAFLFSGIVVILCMRIFFQTVFQRIKELLNIRVQRIATLIFFSIAVGLLYSLIAFMGLKFNLVVQKSALLETFGFANILLLILFTLVVATVEEIVFRGVELSYLLMRFKPWVSVLVISIVFSLGHIQYSGILPYISLFLFGVVTSFLVVRTNTLYLAIGMHFGWNLANSILSQYYILDHNILSYWGSAFELLEIGILILIFFSSWIYTRSQFFLKRTG